MNSFEDLQNKYAKVANNFDKNSALNNNFRNLHKMNREELAKDYDEYSKLFGNEILFDVNSNVCEDNRCFDKYLNWMLNGD